MFDNLSDKLERAFKVLRGEGKINEINIAETVKEIRKALLDADVSFQVAKKFTDDVKAAALQTYRAADSYFDGRFAGFR